MQAQEFQLITTRNQDRRFVLLDIIENHYNEIVYKSTHHDFINNLLIFVIYMILKKWVFNHLEY